jgi:sigma-E factor negative regulatory protein RseC
MAIEEGLVTKLGSHGAVPTAWIKIVRSGACESCSSRHSCSAGKGDQNQEVEAVNDVHARAGDRIQVAMATGSLLKATFLLYLFPVLCMIVGGLIGHWASENLHFQGSWLSVVLSMAFLALAMTLVRIKGRRMGTDKAYQPRIVRIIGRDPVSALEAEGRRTSGIMVDGTISPTYHLPV